MPAFPGAVPASRADAYAIQDGQITLRSEEIIGWKVAMTAKPFIAAFGEERLAGPVFASRLFTCKPNGRIIWHMIAGGFAAVEAEFVAVMGQDAPHFDTMPTPEMAAALVASVHVGIELAGSPLATINDLGPMAVVADCGNNDGVIVGPAIADWRAGGIDAMQISMMVDEVAVGQGSAAAIRGGPMAAVAFMLAHAQVRGRPLKAGHIISTGATTGIHKVVSGQKVHADFGGGYAVAVDVQ
ncbi:MAG: 2-keto-4-pentenoate hydratase [Beijerinckiaceae bacterium]